MHVSEDFYHFIERRCIGGEPRYRTLDRLMLSYIQNNGESEELEGLREAMQLLRLENREIKDGLMGARRKIRDYELRLGIISIEAVRLQERNEQIIQKD